MFVLHPDNDRHRDWFRKNFSELDRSMPARLVHRIIPKVAPSRLVKAQIAVPTPGVRLLAPGIALAVLDITEALAVIGSLVTLVSMALFAAVVMRSRANL